MQAIAHEALTCTFMVVPAGFEPADLVASKLAPTSDNRYLTSTLPTTGAEQQYAQMSNFRLHYCTYIARQRASTCSTSRRHRPLSVIAIMNQSLLVIVFSLTAARLATSRG